MPRGLQSFDVTKVANTFEIMMIAIAYTFGQGLTLKFLFPCPRVAQEIFFKCARLALCFNWDVFGECLYEVIMIEFRIMSP